MASIRTFFSFNLSSTILLFLCMISGSGIELKAQDVSSSTSTESSVLTLPHDPSAELQSAQAPSAPPQEAAPIKAPNPNYRPMKVRERLFLYDLIGPGAFLVTGVQAGVDQGRTLKVPYPPDGFVGPGNHPAHGAIPEWGEGFDGYAKRYASRYGQNLAGTTIKYGLGELLREDVTYHRCDCTGVPASHIARLRLFARSPHREWKGRSVIARDCLPIPRV